MCIDCKMMRWPVWKSNRGKWHCGVCLRPDDGLPPACHQCNKRTWDGWNPYYRWWCAACFCAPYKKGSDMMPDIMRWKWSNWFRARRLAYPEVFGKDDGEQVPEVFSEHRPGGEAQLSLPPVVQPPPPPGSPPPSLREVSVVRHGGGLPPCSSGAVVQPPPPPGSPPSSPLRRLSPWA